jgi:hypothetical protein
MGTLTLREVGAPDFREEITVDVIRADGLFDTTLPPPEWRARARVSHHDATTDLEGTVDDAAYCCNFAFCI